MRRAPVLSVAYSPSLVFGAALVALMAAFTGMHLIQGVAALPARARQPQIVKAAIVLGGGIWSTHFVAMLAVDLPVAVFYDAIYTLASALIAILLAGGALLLLHAGPRSDIRTAASGAILGLGVVVMHYVGMLGMRGCTPVFAATGYALASVLAVAMGVGALRLAQGARSKASLGLGAALLAMAILAMHFTAMRWTGFLADDPAPVGPGLVANESLALFVVLAAFLICGAFLLTTATLGDAGAAEAPGVGAADALAVPPPAPAPVGLDSDVVEAGAPAPAPGPMRRVPYEKDGRTFFIGPEEIVAIQAEGHYTRLHRAGDQLFCPLAITKLDAALGAQQFMRTHRSYLVNLRHVRGFERRKDQGVCLFDPTARVAPVPVSRTRVAPIMKALGL